MKTAVKYLITFFLLASLISCNDTEDGSFVEPITTYEKINGNWRILSVKQIDEIAKAAAQSPSEMTLTSLFDFSTFSISLSVDEHKKPTTFKIEGTSPAFFLTEGYWKLNRDFPSTDGVSSAIELYNDAAKQIKAGELIVVSTPSGKQEMELKFTRKDKDIAFVSYVYNLILIEKSNNE